MNYYDRSTYRSPETKTEVQQAAKVLFGVGTLFISLALFGIVMRFVDRDSDYKFSNSAGENFGG